MKKLSAKMVSLFLCVLLAAVALTGCSGDGDSSSPAASASSDASASAGGETASAPEETAESDLKVGFVTSAAGQNDNGYNRSAVDSVKEAAAEYGFEYKIVEPSDSLTVGQAIESLAEEGFDLIFNLEYDFAALIDGTGATGNTPIAEQYPDTTFVIYNDNPNVNEDGSVKYDNVYACLFNVNEASYLAGYLAVQMNENQEALFPEGYDLAPLSESRGIGFIGGTESAGIRVYSYGYMLGIQAAAEEYDVDYDYYPVYDAGFTDSAAGNTTAGNMYQSGVNVVFADCGNVGDGITERAESDGRLAIQTDADLDDTHPGYIITSVLKITGVPTRSIIDAVVSGDISDMDNLLNFDLASGATGITDLSVIGEYVADTAVFDEIVEKLEGQADQIKSSAIKVVNAQNGEEFDPATCPNVTVKTSK